MKTLLLMSMVSVMVGLLAILSLSSEASAATYKVNFSGKGGEASWDQCSGDICTYTSIGAADQVWKSKGDKSSSKALWFYESTYDYSTGNYSDRYGQTESVTFSISKNKLDSASASVDVPITVCDNFGCSDGGVVHVEVSWTGQGSISTTKGKTTNTFDNVKVVFGDKSKYRDASATGSIDGNSLGSSNWGYLFEAKQSYMEIIH